MSERREGEPAGGARRMGGAMELDHLAVACADLHEGAAWVEDRLGVPLEAGGRHARFGTWNRLLSLGPGLYLEVIAPDPAAPPPARPRWFGLDAAGAPALSNWIVRTEDLGQAPPEAGEALDLARDDLAWTVLVPADGGLPFAGGYPTLIRWGPGGHPADRLPDRGVRLLGLEVGHPRAARLRDLLAPLADPRVAVVTADAPTLRARLALPAGEAWL